MQIAEDPARYFSRLAQGSLGQACRWAQLELDGGDLYKMKKQLVTSLANCRYDKSLDMAGWLIDQSKKLATVWAQIDSGVSKTDVNRRAHATIIRIIMAAMHDSMKLNLDPDATVVNFDQSGQIKALAQRFDCELCAERIADCCVALRQIASNVNEKLVFERLLLNFTGSGIIMVSEQ
jgi:hypothetical protein